MGISVKSRSRQLGTEKDYLGITNDNFDKVDKACLAFGCSPYFAIIIDAGGSILAFILSKKKLLSLFPTGRTVLAWKTGDKYVEMYKNDKEIIAFKFAYETLSWWG